MKFSHYTPVSHVVRLVFRRKETFCLHFTVSVYLLGQYMMTSILQNGHHINCFGKFGGMGWKPMEDLARLPVNKHPTKLIAIDTI